MKKFILLAVVMIFFMFQSSYADETLKWMANACSSNTRLVKIICGRLISADLIGFDLGQFTKTRHSILMNSFFPINYIKTADLFAAWYKDERKQLKTNEEKVKFDYSFPYLQIISFAKKNGWINSKQIIGGAK